MKKPNLKQFVFLCGLLLTAAYCGAIGQSTVNIETDGYSHIIIKEGTVHGSPKSTSIVATLDGHWLSVVFLENLGQVNIGISGVDNCEVQAQSTPTPEGVDFYILNTGSFVVTFTLPNGDVYFGEFEIID